MERHYQERLDELFYSNWKHRTLRTLFDPLSSEWNKTDMPKKIEILNKILATGIPLSYWIEGYREFYTSELANKEHVVDRLPYGLSILNENASGQTKLDLEEAIKNN